MSGEGDLLVRRDFVCVDGLYICCTGQTISTSAIHDAITHVCDDKYNVHGLV